MIKTIKKDGVPESEVLAFGYQNNFLVGYINKVKNEYECESESELLSEVFAYIEIKDLQKIFITFLALKD